MTYACRGYVANPVPHTLLSSQCITMFIHVCAWLSGFWAQVCISSWTCIHTLSTTQALNPSVPAHVFSRFRWTSAVRLWIPFRLPFPQQMWYEERPVRESHDTLYTLSTTPWALVFGYIQVSGFRVKDTGPCRVQGEDCARHGLEP